MFKACDGPACATLLAKVSLEKSLTARLDETRAQMFQKVCLYCHTQPTCMPTRARTDVALMPVPLPSHSTDSNKTPVHTKLVP